MRLHLVRLLLALLLPLLVRLLREAATSASGVAHTAEGGLLRLVLLAVIHGVRRHGQRLPMPVHLCQHLVEVRRGCGQRRLAGVRFVWRLNGQMPIRNVGVLGARLAPRLVESEADGHLAAT